MLQKTIVQLLNEQITKELYSAYLYLDMSNYYYDQNLEGFGNWFKIQAQEERDHALLFMTYLQNNSHRPTLQAIDAPTLVYDNFKAPLLAALEHEQFVTASINHIYDEAMPLKDFRSIQFLDWFIKEQGEEEKNTDDLCKKFDLFGQDAKGLYMLDAELKTRVYAPPSLVL